MDKKKIILLAVGFSLAVMPGVQAMTVYDPTNHAENLATKLQMITQVEKSTQILEAQLKQLQKLDKSNLSKSLSQITGAAETMADIRKQTDAIGSDWAGMLTKWNEANPDYTTWNGVSAAKYAEQAKKNRTMWAKALQQAVGMSSMGGSIEQAKTQSAVADLLEASNSAEGSLQAVQALTQLTALMISEQQKLQALMAESIRSQATYQETILDGQNQLGQITKEFNANSGSYKDVKMQTHGEGMHHF